MLPQTLSGQRGSPELPRRMGAGAIPSFWRAWRAHSRPRVKSRLRLSDTEPSSASSSGRSSAAAVAGSSTTAAVAGTSDAMVNMFSIRQSDGKPLRETKASIGRRLLWLLVYGKDRRAQIVDRLLDIARLYDRVG